MALVGRGLRRGAADEPAGAAQRRVQQLSLVPRHGPRVLRGPAHRRLPQRALRQRQGRPRGTPRRRRRLHGGRAGGHRPGWLAHDRVSHAGCRALLLRDLLPARAPPRHALLPAGAGGGAQRLDRPAGRGRRGRREDHPGPVPARDRLRRHRGPGEEELSGALLGLTREYDPQRGGFGGAPKFPPSMALEFLLRHHARTGSEGALEMARDTCERMARGGSTTSSRAGSRATPSTASGSSRTSRRCSTTTPCCVVCMRTCGAVPVPSWPGAWPSRPPTSSCVNSAPTRVGSPPPSTPTATTGPASTSRVPTTSGRPHSSARSWEKTPNSPSSTSA